MKKLLKGVLALIFTVLLALILARLSHDMIGKKVSHGEIRLYWRIAGQKNEICREYTQEELEKLAVHMRKKQVCEQKLLSYHLIFKANQKTLLDQKIHPTGLKHDRPLVVFESLALPPGHYQLDLSFIPLSDQPLYMQRHMTEDAILPKSYRFFYDVDLAEGRILLLTLNSDQTKIISIEQSINR